MYLVVAVQDWESRASNEICWYCLCKDFILTYLLTPWSRVLLEKLTGLQLVKKFPTFYGTRRFIIAFTSARHLSLSWATSIRSITLHPTSWIPVLILSSHLRLGLPVGLLSSDFPTKNLYTHLLSSIRATCPPISFFLIITRNILGEEYRSLSSSLCTYLQSPVNPSLLGPNILLSILFSNTPSRRSSLNVSDQVSQNNRQNYSSVYFNLQIFGYQTVRQKILHRMTVSIPWLHFTINFHQANIMNIKIRKFFMVQHPPVDLDLLIVQASRSHSDTPHSVGRTPLNEWSARYTDLYLKTHNSQAADNHGFFGNRTRKLNEFAATKADLRLRGHRNRRK